MIWSDHVSSLAVVKTYQVWEFISHIIIFHNQFDALIERMTGREMLTMYARLRGVPSNKIEDLVSATIKHLNLTNWADKLCGDYRWEKLLIILFTVNFSYLHYDMIQRVSLCEAIPGSFV